MGPPALFWLTSYDVASDLLGVESQADAKDQWKGSNSKQSARWQHVSRLKASAFYIW
jgi:hypothetical protein